MIRKFLYVKDNDEATDRAVLVISEPSKFLFCLDVTDKDNQEELHKAFEALRTKHKEESKALVEKLGLSKDYRRFSKEGIFYDQTK